jgi:hypothetical protein
MATIKQRIDHLFSINSHDENNPIATVALIFAERRGKCLAHADVIRLIDKKFGHSTICKAFKKLSDKLEILGGNSFIDIEYIKQKNRGRPAIRGKLSKAAAERLFELVTPVKEKPPSSFRLIDKEGKVEVPPLLVKGERDEIKRLPPEDILRLRAKKIGKKQTNRLFKRIAKQVAKKKTTFIGERREG